MRRLSLRWKILVNTSALIAALIVPMVIYLNFEAKRFVNERIGRELEQGRDRVEAAEAERLADLRLMARLVASYSMLKALLVETDPATIRDFLLTFQQENKGPDLLVVLDSTGRVAARTDVAMPEPMTAAGSHWVQRSPGHVSAGVLATESGVYHAVVMPAEAGGTVFGFVVAGARIDNTLAQTLLNATQDEVLIVDANVLGSTLPDTLLPWRSREQWEAALGGLRGQPIIDLSGERYMARAIQLGVEGGPRPLVVLLQSRDRALQPYRRIQLALLVIGILAALAGVVGSAVSARAVTAPIAKLVEGTRQVAAGNFDFRLDVRSNDEIGDLAQSFNQMIRGLREHADMRKFVSQSTVEMIQASSPKKVSEGERKLLTVLFSDMRGFSSMAERKSPEEVVKILNCCLSLQAEKVKKFHGDIDKYVGDCVVAHFVGEDMELNAIRCAVEIHKALDAYNAAHSPDDPLHVGIGIVTGDVILGSVGSEDRSDFTAIGSNVNLCARLCSTAGPGEILLAESTYQRVRDLVAATRLDPISVKGFTEPIPVYRMSIR